MEISPPEIIESAGYWGYSLIFIGNRNMLMHALQNQGYQITPGFNFRSSVSGVPNLIHKGASVDAGL